jgi:hypothetical protein
MVKCVYSVNGFCMNLLYFLFHKNVCSTLIGSEMKEQVNDTLFFYMGNSRHSSKIVKAFKGFVVTF